MKYTDIIIERKYHTLFWPYDKGYEMYKVMKFFIFLGVLLVAAFFANHFGLVSIPWLDVKPVATYGDDAVRSEEAVKKVFED